MKKILITLSIALLSACSVPNTNSFVELPKTKILNTNPKSIKGIVQFPLLSHDLSFTKRGEKDFNTKADFNDVSKQSSVSIIYPPDSVNANKVLSSTVSDDNGNFDLNLTKNPENNEILIIEASKRIGGVGSNKMSLRTYIRWNGEQWQSITNSGIFINNHTTAITIIENNNLITPDETINSLQVTNGTMTPSDIGTSPNIITTQTINTLTTLIANVLNQNYDPIYSIRYSDNQYYLDRNIDTTATKNIYNLDKILQTGSCLSCDLTNVNLLNFKFNSVNLTGSNLSGLDLTNRVLTNSNLTQVNLSNTNLSNKNLTSNTSLLGVNLSKSNLENAILSGKTLSTSTTQGNLSESYLVNVKLIGSVLQNANLNYAFLINSDLSNADLSNANLTNADLTGANITNTVFTGADLSGAKWVNGNICLSNSIGQCNQ